LNKAHSKQTGPALILVPCPVLRFTKEYFNGCLVFQSEIGTKTST